MNVRMKKTTATRIMAVLVLLIVLVQPAEAVVVDIPDPGLEAAIRDYLHMPTGPIEDRDLRLIIVLLADDMGITDLTGLEYCDYLRHLFLHNNNISDISALSGLSHLEEVFLWNNPLSYEAINTDIPALQSRGVEVYFSYRIPWTLLKVSGDTQSNWIGFTLPESFVVQVLDHKGTPFAGVPVTFSVTAGGGSLDIVDTTTDADGFAQATFTVGSGTNTVEVAAAEILTPITFNATGLEPTIGDVLDFMYTSVEAGTLVGDGPGMSAQKRLEALANMLEEAQRLINEGLLKEAYEQLAYAYSRADGENRPPDFVAGPAASELAYLIQYVMDSL
jgi:hypothetical protein